MLQRVRSLLSLGGGLRLMGGTMLALSGAVLSPQFLNPEFPGPAVWLSPQAWSVAFSMGAAVLVTLLWLGIGLMSALAGRAFGQAPVGGPVANRDLLRWALGLQLFAFTALLAAGGRSMLPLALAGTALGNAFFLPPYRLGQNEWLANLLIGGGVTGTMLIGMMALGKPSQVGVIAALTVGQLAAVMALVRDYSQFARDWRWRWGSLLLVGASHLLALAMLVQRTGLQQPLLSVFPALAMINLYLLDRVGREPAYTPRAVRLTQYLFMGVVLLYVGAQTYY